MRRARAGMVGHGRSFFERTAVLEVSGNAGCAEGVIANLGGNPGGVRAAADHQVGVHGVKRGFRELAGSAPDGAEEGAFGIKAEAAPVDVGVQVGLKIVVARQLMALAALLVQLDP